MSNPPVFPGSPGGPESQQPAAVPEAQFLEPQIPSAVSPAESAVPNAPADPFAAPAPGSAPSYAPSGYDGAPVGPAKPVNTKLLVGLGIGAGALVLVGAGLAIAGSVLGNTYSPEAQVKSHLDAVIRGDIEKALDISGGYVGEASDLLLTNEIYQAAAGELTSYQVRGVETTGKKSTVMVTLVDQAGEELLQEYSLTTKTKELVFFDKWALAPITLPTIETESAGPEGMEFTVNGIPLDTSELDGPISAAVFAGTYDLGAAESEFYAVKGSEPLIVGLSSSVEQLALEIVLSPKGEEAATIAVDAYTDGCFAQTALKPEGCQFGGRAPILTTVGPVTWRIDNRPVLEFGAWNGSGFTVGTATPGSYSGTAEGSDLISGRSGPVTFDGTGKLNTTGVITGFDDTGAAIFDPDEFITFF